VEPQEVAVLARDPVALGNLGGSARDLGDALKLARRRADANDRCDRIPERRRIEVGVVAADGPGTLEALDPLGDRRRGEPDAAPELRHAQTTLGLQLAEDAQVDVVEQIRCVGSYVPRPCFARQLASNSVDRLFHYGTAGPTMSGVTSNAIPMLGSGRRLATSPPPHAYFVVSAVFHYLGPALAVLLFVRVEPLGVAWFRIASAAAIFALWRRPWRRLSGADRETRSTLVWLGLVLAIMNVCFYIAIDRLPLGTVATIEFLPVIALAAVGARTVRNVAALGLAVTGVYLLTDIRLAGDALGVGLAFANAALFAAYIVLAHRLARSRGVARLDGLAASMVLAAVFVTALAGWSAVPSLRDPVAIVAGIGIGIASSVIPYALDQLAMARLSRSTYSLMVSLFPALATVIGVVVLAQIPTPVEGAAVVLVAAAVALHRDSP
jgi:inner membrane transporter RhtA